VLVYDVCSPYSGLFVAARYLELEILPFVRTSNHKLRLSNVRIGFFKPRCDNKAATGCTRKSYSTLREARDGRPDLAAIVLLIFDLALFGHLITLT